MKTSRTAHSRPFLLFLAIALSAAPPAAAQTLPAGVWRSAGFGYIANAERRRVRTYDVTARGCVRGPVYEAQAFSDLYGASELGESNRIVLHRGETLDFLERLEALPRACRRPLRGASPALNFEVFKQTFAEFYPFFAERGVDWDAAVAAARPQATQDLFTTLAALAAQLGDGHVTISAGEREFDPDFVRAPGTAPDGSAWSWRTLRSSLRDYLQGAETPLREAARFAGNRRVLYGRTADNLGYIAILAQGGWAEGQDEDTPAAQHAAAAGEVMDAVLAELADARGIVIDLRVNSGGFDTVSFEVASRFTSQPRLAFTRQAQRERSPRYDVMLAPSARRRFSGPVAVLIGANTVSAGESAALALAALPHARLFGQPTRGILSDAIPKTLPNGWEFTLSVETLRTPEGEVVEARGVQPGEATATPTSVAPETLWGADIAHASAWLLVAQPASAEARP